VEKVQVQLGDALGVPSFFYDIVYIQKAFELLLRTGTARNPHHGTPEGFLNLAKPSRTFVP
jgi:hypothetical protein